MYSSKYSKPLRCKELSGQFHSQAALHPVRNGGVGEVRDRQPIQRLRRRERTLSPSRNRGQFLRHVPHHLAVAWNKLTRLQRIN
jgi:hypothetical protein